MPRYSTLRKALRKEIPAGQFATREFLLQRGFVVHSINNLLKSGDMVSLARGAYAQDEPLTVAGIVRSLQRMGNNLVVGGETALRLHGTLRAKPAELFSRVSLSGSARPPSWLFKWDDRVQFDYLGTARLFKFSRLDTASLDDYVQFVREFGWMGVTFRISSVERAMFEMLSEVPRRVSFDDARNLMERAHVHASQVTLRRLLDQSVGVKVNRLFLWSAERLRYGCVQGLDRARYIGTGRMQLVDGGRYVRRYLMTVPKEFGWSG